MSSFYNQSCSAMSFTSTIECKKYSKIYSPLLYKVVDLLGGH